MGDAPKAANPPGELRTGRWNDPPSAEEGTRVLVCRYRPRGVPKTDEPWDEWWPELGPSKALHAAAYGKGQEAIPFEEYSRRFLLEMEAPRARFYLRALTDRLARGESLTLLCSSACTDEARCHRSLLRALVVGALRSRNATDDDQATATRSRSTEAASDKRRWIGVPGRPIKR